MKRASQILGTAALLAILALLIWFIVSATPGSGGVRWWAWPIVAVVLGLWLLACWRVKIWFNRAGQQQAERRARAIFASTPVRVGLAMLAFPLAIAWMVGFTALFGRTGSLLIASLSNIYMALMWTGFALIGLAFVRHGDEPRCRKCQYDLAGAPEGGFHLCPECGANLRLPHGVMKGTRRIILPMLVSGVVVVLASFASMGLFIRGSGTYMPYLPTGSLIREVTSAPRGFTSGEWAELLTRQLTPQQTEQLFQGLLELREARGYYSNDAEGWMDQAAMAASVPPDLIERYYQGMLRLWIAAPEVARRGATPTLRFGFGGDFRGNIHVPANSVLQVWFVPESLTVDGQPADMLNNPTDPIYGIHLGTADRSFRGVRPDPVNPATEGPIANLDLARVSQDTVELRGTGWLYVAPHGTPPPTTAATIPATAVWSTHVDVRKTVRIEP